MRLGPRQPVERPSMVASEVEKEKEKGNDREKKNSGKETKKNNNKETNLDGKANRVTELFRGVFFVLSTVRLNRS